MKVLFILLYGKLPGGIGCDHSTIVRALKDQREKGVNRFIKKRYIVKVLNNDCILKV